MTKPTKWHVGPAKTQISPIDRDFIFDRMFFKLAGYEDSYKISDNFFWSYLPLSNEIFSHRLKMETMLSR